MHLGIAISLGSAALRNAARPTLALDSPGASGDFADASHTASAFTPSTTLRIEARVQADAGGAFQSMIAVWVNGGSRAWRFRFSSGNNLDFQWFTGSADVSARTTATVDPTALGWFAAELDLATGDVAFETSADGEAWSALETVSGSGATSVDDSATDLTLLAHTNGAAGRLAGLLYRARIYVDGTLEFDADPSTGSAGGSSFDDVEGGLTVNVNGNATLVEV